MLPACETDNDVELPKQAMVVGEAAAVITSAAATVTVTGVRVLSQVPLLIETYNVVVAETE